MIRVRICVVEDDPGFRRRLVAALDAVSEWTVADECADGASAIAAVSRSAPDLILLDLRLPDMDGAEVARRLRASSCSAPIVILTVETRTDHVIRALAAGANGYLLKGADAAGLRRGVAEFLEGEAALSPAVARRLIAWFQRRAAAASGPAAGLTERQWQLLRLAARGKTQKEIAEAMALSLHTVKNHCRNIYEKLGVHSMREALVRAKGNASLLADDVTD